MGSIVNAVSYFITSPLPKATSRSYTPDSAKCRSNTIPSIDPTPLSYFSSASRTVLPFLSVIRADVSSPPPKICIFRSPPMPPFLGVNDSIPVMVNRSVMVSRKLQAELVAISRTSYTPGLKFTMGMGTVLVVPLPKFQVKLLVFLDSFTNPKSLAVRVNENEA